MRKKINKIRKNKFADRLCKAGEVKTIDESYVFTFGQLKDMKIRSAIIADFKYVDWCVQEGIFKLNKSLQKLFKKTVEENTYTEEEAIGWAEMFDKKFDRYF